MADSRDFVIGVLVGGAIGAAAALLYAPQAGADTRRTIREKADEAKTRTTDLAQAAKTRTTDLAHQAQTRAADLAHQAKDKATGLAHQAQTRVEDLKTQAKTRVDDLTHQAHEIVDRSREAVERQKVAVLSAVDAGKQAYIEKQHELQQDVEEDSQPALPPAGSEFTTTPVSGITPAPMTGL